jgi:hypothetical protein
MSIHYCLLPSLPSSSTLFITIDIRKIWLHHQQAPAPAARNRQPSASNWGNDEALDPVLEVASVSGKSSYLSYWWY